MPGLNGRCDFERARTNNFPTLRRCEVKRGSGPLKGNVYAPVWGIRDRHVEDPGLFWGVNLWDALPSGWKSLLRLYSNYGMLSFILLSITTGTTCLQKHVYRAYQDESCYCAEDINRSILFCLYRRHYYEALKLASCKQGSPGASL